MSLKIWISGAPLKAQVNTLTVGGSPQLPTPATPVLTTPSGTSNGAAVFVVTTYTNDAGETTPSGQSTATPTTGEQVQVAAPSAQGSGAGAATGYNVYSGTVSNGPYYLQNTGGPVVIGTNYLIPGTPAGSGSNPPTSNTAAGMTYTVLMGINNTKSVSYTSVAADTNITTAAALQALLAASVYPEFEEETWANVNSAIVTATASSPGMPFSLSIASTGTGTLVNATTTSNSGPNDIACPANWSSNTLPQDGDDLYIINNSNSLLYHLDAFSSVVLNSLTWNPTFTGNAALPSFNANGYEEYRPTSFAIGTPVENFIPGSGSGSALIRRDNGATAWTVNVGYSGIPSVTGRPALFLKGSSSSNTMNVTKGYVGSAIDPGETSTWASIAAGYQSSPQTDVNLMLGDGCTVNSIKQTGGKLAARCPVTTWTQDGGTATFYGNVALGTLDVEGGSFSYQSSGTCTALTVGIDGTLDCTADPRSRTVINATIYGDFLDPNKTVVFTNAAYFPVGVSANTKLGSEIHLQRS